MGWSVSSASSIAWVGVNGSRQDWQSRRTRRWARTAFKRRGDQERLDTHVQQAGDSGGGAVGVQGREDGVAGQRGLHRHLGRLEVADFADHHHVGVLAQEGPQGGGEGQPIWLS